MFFYSLKMEELFEKSDGKRELCDGFVENDRSYHYTLYNDDSNGSLLLSVRRITTCASLNTTIFTTFKTFDEFKESKVGIEIFESRIKIPMSLRCALVNEYCEVNIENVYYYLNRELLNSNAKSARVKK